MPAWYSLALQAAVREATCHLLGGEAVLAFLDDTHVAAPAQRIGHLHETHAWNAAVEEPTGIANFQMPGSGLDDNAGPARFPARVAGLGCPVRVRRGRAVRAESQTRTARRVAALLPGLAGLELESSIKQPGCHCCSALTLCLQHAARGNRGDRPQPSCGSGALLGHAAVAGPRPALARRRETAAASALGFLGWADRLLACSPRPCAGSPTAYDRLMQMLQGDGAEVPLAMRRPACVSNGNYEAPEPHGAERGGEAYRPNKRTHYEGGSSWHGRCRQRSKCTFSTLMPRALLPSQAGPTLRKHPLSSRPPPN